MLPIKMKLSEIPKIVINLPSRKDRLEQVKKELAGWDYTIIEGVVNEKPMLGIAQAHINAVMIAQQNEWDQVLIMEDDLVLRPGAETYLNEALNNLPDSWDILLGGCYDCKQLSDHNKYWNQVGEFCGIHFYIVNKTAYQRFLDYDGHHHIDRWINLRSRVLRCFITKKFVATQRNGFSDNCKKEVDYSNKIAKYQLL
jgi:hypothetical protein